MCACNMNACSQLDALATSPTAGTAALPDLPARRIALHGQALQLRHHAPHFLRSTCCTGSSVLRARRRKGLCAHCPLSTRSLHPSTFGPRCDVSCCCLWLWVCMQLLRRRRLLCACACAQQLQPPLQLTQLLHLGVRLGGLPRPTEAPW